MNCYACEQAAIQHCSRCGKGYCADHGETPSAGRAALCAECLSPASATPSNVIFRSSLFALLVASVLALWLLVRPPDLPGEESTLQPQPTALNTTQGPSAPPGESPTAAPPGEATPTPAPAAETPPPTNQYTVVEGDTWFGIAGALGVDAEALAAANGRTLEDFIQPGEVLVIPQ
jgi:hypothetical protein